LALDHKGRGEGSDLNAKAGVLGQSVELAAGVPRIATQRVGSEPIDRSNELGE
jgi:hypothetical protein